jgi:putative glycosyltransferase
VRLSIVTTLYQSAGTINEFYRRSMRAAEPLGYEVEFVIVNDGSPDGSLDLALALHRADPRVTVVDLSRNFGHHKALMTGLAYATGDLVFMIDSDLEEEPEELSRLHARFAQGDCDVVYGVQEKRRGNLFRRWPGELFFLLVQALSDQPVPRNSVAARLMTRDYVRALVRYRDREFMLMHLMQLAGFRQIAVPIRKRSQSSTTYSLRMRTEMAIKFLTTTSTRLLYLLLYVGVFIFGLSTTFILYYIGRYLTSGIGVDGFTSQIVSIWFLGGLITLILGILSVYMANILVETRRRPYVVVRHLHRVQAPAAVGPGRGLDQINSATSAASPVNIHSQSPAASLVDCVRNSACK